MALSSFAAPRRLPGIQNVLEADVLVIGGGPAGAWAAIAAAAQGVRVVLAEKGFFGTSGATAPSGTGVWHVPQEQREAAKQARFVPGGMLAEQEWMDRVLEQTWHNTEQLADWGYPYPRDSLGALHCNSLQGPDYMRLLRKQARQAGVRILDQHPALELLVDEAGRVAGAQGVSRGTDQAWTLHAGAVVMASGGCAFLSRALGCNVLTGDGYLMAAEAGAELSGMEFSNAYGLGPAFSSVTKSLFYNWATFYDRHGVAIEGAGSAHGRGIIARTLQSQPVYACLDKADAQIQAWMRLAQPNFFLPFDRMGIDPFTGHFPVTLRLEGTVRGTGGLHVVDGDCATNVPGLYAAGDAATRELICGGFTGGGSHNAAWAMSSGFWAGAAAADFSRRVRSQATRQRFAAGRAGLDGDGHQPAPHDPQELIEAVQAEVFPYAHNWSRQAATLESSLQRLDALWGQWRNARAPDRAQALRTREAVAMLATARWMYRSALYRKESRGMARRSDYPALDAGWHCRVISSGLDEIGLRRQPVVTTATVVPAAPAQTLPQKVAA